MSHRTPLLCKNSNGCSTSDTNASLNASSFLVARLKKAIEQPDAVLGGEAACASYLNIFELNGKATVLAVMLGLADVEAGILGTGDAGEAHV